MDSLKAIVEKIVINGKHGSYVVTRCEKLGTVTFSLKDLVWKGNGSPEPGEYVMLSDIRQKRAGWRAMSARHWRPDDSSNQ